MALGEIVGQVKARATSVKVQPFDGQGVRLETDMTLELHGRITGTEVATAYGVMAPDGTGTSKAFGIITTSDGEAITAESFAILCPPTATGTKFRGLVYLKTNSQKYAWLNTTPIAMEGETNVARTELAATLYEWK